MRDLNFELKQLCQRNRDGSFSTQYARERILTMIAIVFGTAVSQCEQLLQHDGDLDTVWRTQRVELQRVATDRQYFFVCRACYRPIGRCKFAAVGFDPSPDFGRRIGV